MLEGVRRLVTVGWRGGWSCLQEGGMDAFVAGGSEAMEMFGDAFFDVTTTPLH